MSDQKYEDKNLDENLQNGPIEKRGCTDPFCCLLFVAFVIAAFILAFYGFGKGNPSLLAVPYDPDGHACGLEDYKDYPYIYFATPWPGYFHRTVCMKSCPKYMNDTDQTNVKLNCKNNKVVNCETDPKIYMNGDFDHNKIPNLNSSIIVYNTSGLFGKICFPSTSLILEKMENLTDKVDAEDLAEWFNDIKDTWPIIIASAGIAIVIGLVFMVLIRFCAGPLTWLAILAWIASFVLLGIFLNIKAQDAKDNMMSGKTSSNPMMNSYKALLAIAIVSFITAGISVLIVLCLWSKINLAIAIIKAASDFVKALPSIMLVPIVFIIINALWWAFWLSATIFLYSVGEVKPNPSSPLASIQWDKNIKYAIIYFLFAGLWIGAFIMALCQFIIASACAIWYWEQNGTHKPISRSIYRAFRYHLGSLAFGSLLLAIVQMIRIILAYVDRQLKNSGAYEGNRCLKCLMKCLQCYAYCFNQFIKFLNKYAYIQVAIQGLNFCSSAREGFSLIFGNPAKFSIVAGIGEIFILLGKLFICAVSTFLAYLIISRSDYYTERLYSQFLPTICFAVVTYMIGVLFMSVYGMSADTILQCYLVDEAVSKKAGKGGPQKCPASLHDFINTRIKN